MFKCTGDGILVEFRSVVEAVCAITIQNAMAEQEYFVDGVTESLTTDLSRIRGSFVIGRNTAFTYKGKAVDLKQIGRELNAR